MGRTEPSIAIPDEALALPEDGASETTTRRLERRPGAVRVRFIDETADYQTGAVVIRSEDAAATGGGVDLDLPVVCGGGLARATAERALEGEATQSLALTLMLGPLEALRLEPGDGVRRGGRDWRVTRMDLDETPKAVLEPASPPRPVVEDDDWRGGETPGTVGRRSWRCWICRR